MFYTIQNNGILTAENEYALSRFYGNVQILPEDYEVGKYIVENGVLVRNPNYEAEQEERLNHLTCTALDIATLIKTLGMTDTEILQFLNANPSIQLQLTLCKDVYCGVVRQLCPIKLSEKLTLTDEMVVEFFKKKYNIV